MKILKAMLQDAAIILGVFIALRWAGVQLNVWGVLTIAIGLFVYGLRSGFAAYRTGFQRGHDCGTSHKAPVHMEVKDVEEFEKIMNEIKKDFPVK